MQNWPKRQLPENKHPVGTRCIQLEIPDDDDWEHMLYSEAYQLSLWMLWERDEGKNGTVVARQWREALKTWRHCDGTPTVVNGGGASDEMAIRQDPDNPCLLQSSIDGTNWCTFADLSKCMNFGTQPGGTQPQPQPGGGSQQYCAKLNANDRLLIPTLVNTGDTVTIDSANGAGNDTSLVIDNWYCPDGERYLFGACVGQTSMSGSDPIPTVNHMHLIFGLSVAGAIQYASAPIGAPLTIPSGVSNAQLWVQVNDDPINDNTGSYDVCVTVKNNQTVPWSHTLNLATNPSLFSPCGNGAWTGGVGFTDTLVNSGPNSYRGVNLCLTGVPAFTLTRLAFTCTATLGSNPQQVDLVLQPGNILQFQVSNQAGMYVFDTGIISRAGVTGFEFDDSVGQGASGGDPGGTLVIPQIFISGTGPDPFA